MQCSRRLQASRSYVPAALSGRLLYKGLLRQQQQQQRLGVLTHAKRGDVLLVAEGISKTHDGEKILFNNLTLSLLAGDKLAVVGPNGAGKSTLLRIMSGQADHDSGQISRNRGAKIGYLPQGDLLLYESRGDTQLESMTVLQAVLASDSEPARAVQSYQRALSEAGGGITPQLEAAIEAMDTHNAWEVDSDARRILEAVGLKDPNAAVGRLSGGQRRRLALASALLGSPDLLVLDEPTNHMDVEMIDWMACELAQAQDMAVVMVSHDRAFMERCCGRLLELDHGGFNTTHPFGGPGSYDAFKEARAARRHAQANAAADARTLLRKESEWMARQPKARSTKAKARVDAYGELLEKARDTPAADLRVDFGRVGMARLGSKAVLHEGNKAVLLEGGSYSTPTGRPLLRDFSFEFLPGQRIGIAGPNGVGKSTLLDIVAGVKELQSGRRELGETAVLGYFQQHPPPVEGGLRLVDYIRSVAEKRKARGGAEAGVGGAQEPPEILLEKLGFPRKKQFQKVESLSGGERRRLHLAAVLASAPNVLLLDEPTNDLDLTTIEVLEEMLQVYQGLLLVVSHDRAFMEGATDSLLLLPGDGSIQKFQGSYGDYLRELAALRQQQAAAAVEQHKKARRQHLLQKLGREMEQLEAAQAKLNERLMKLSVACSDMAAIEEASTALAALQAEYEAKEERWFELAEIAGDI
ncbi:P-loop containing nucleoside triphosphate hydrolase protein [Scenedesmus sp. NREL 46B-D3]|nr:P-loop containing nucleoside triphosphate hydrolase protein [Scenedesmus sp. NREL 46B-D3]